MYFSADALLGSFLLHHVTTLDLPRMHRGWTWPPRGRGRRGVLDNFSRFAFIWHRSVPCEGQKADIGEGDGSAAVGRRGTPWREMAGLVLLLQLLSLQCLAPLQLYGGAQQIHSEDGYQQHGHPPGHMQPIGSHRDPEGSIDVVEGFIEPHQFYLDYVKTSRPLLFRGGAKALPAYQRWNDAYINEKYGNLRVQVETKKKEDRLQDVRVLTMSEFLQQYQKNEIYMVHDVPAEMDEELGVPKPLLCGGFQDIFQTAVMWFSSGGTRSVLHSDDVDNINCLVDGEKDLIMIDKVFKEDVEADGFITPQGYSQVDIDAVDFEKFPRLQNLPWWKGQMKKGDCLFIPIGWYHQVNSRGRNLAVNLWFYHLLWFNQSDCDAYSADLQHDFLPLSRFELPGPDSPEYIRTELFKPFKQLEQIKVEDVVEKWGHVLSNIEVHEFFQILDTNKDFVISWEEVYWADPANLLATFPELLPDFVLDSQPDEEGEMNEEAHDEL